MTRHEVSLAIVTMVYNEPEFLPVWHRHYAAQVGEAALHVIDHGSNDGSTEHLGAINRLRIPRSPQDDETRTHAISHYCASLLAWYDAVIYVDVDEFLVADPALFASLPDFTRQWPDPIVTATGLDVIHMPHQEAEIDWSRPISEQRRHVRFTSSMCKPSLIRRPVSWAPGFHNTTEAPPQLSVPLFLFHLRYADLNSGLKRLERTREQPWISEDSGRHQRMKNEDWANMLKAMAALDIHPHADLSSKDAELSRWRQLVETSGLERLHERYKLDLHISGDALWRLPDRFVGSF